VLARGGGPLNALAFTVASWFRYLAAERDERGVVLPKNDPMLEDLVRRARAGGEDPGSLLAVRSLFGDILPGAAAFTLPLRGHLEVLYRLGARPALRRCLSGG